MGSVMQTSLRWGSTVMTGLAEQPRPIHLRTGVPCPSSLNDLAPYSQRPKEWGMVTIPGRMPSVTRALALTPSGLSWEKTTARSPFLMPSLAASAALIWIHSSGVISMSQGAAAVRAWA